MSSYYTAAQLEAMRKEKIRKELADSIQRLSIQLQEKHENSVHINNSGNVEISVFVTDDTTSGSGENLSVAKESLTQSANIARTQQDGLDFSGLLISKHRVSKLEEELNSWIERVDERPIITQNDEDLRKIAYSSINKLSEGIAEGIQVNRNLSVYTCLPDDENSKVNVCVNNIYRFTMGKCAEKRTGVAYKRHVCPC